MRTGVIIQARMGSTRLPGKVLQLIGDKPLLAHTVQRLALLKSEVTAVVATSVLPQNDVIAQWCEKQHVPCFRGSEEDVLDRYYQCALHYGFMQIIRLTADNPFTDIEELDRLIALQLKDGYDYSHSFGQMPLGVGAEIFTIKALQRSHAEGHAPNHREHVNEYIQEHPELFRIGVVNIPSAKQNPQLRLTVDTEEDLKLARRLAGQVAGTWLGTEEAIALAATMEVA